MMMIRAEMIDFVRENPFVKITHKLFLKDEYIYGNGIHIYEEHDYLFDEGIRMRSGGAWESGWYLYEEIAKRELDYRYSHTGKEIREWCEECTNNDLAKIINAEYFVKGTNQPSERVYYFVRTFPEPHLARDYEKSPRRTYNRVSYCGGR